MRLSDACGYTSYQCIYETMKYTKDVDYVVCNQDVRKLATWHILILPAYRHLKCIAISGLDPLKLIGRNCAYKQLYPSCKRATSWGCNQSSVLVSRFHCTYAKSAYFGAITFLLTRSLVGFISLENIFKWQSWTLKPSRKVWSPNVLVLAVITIAFFWSKKFLGKPKILFELQNKTLVIFIATYFTLHSQPSHGLLGPYIQFGFSAASLTTNLYETWQRRLNVFDACFRTLHHICNLFIIMRTWPLMLLRVADSEHVTTQGQSFNFLPCQHFFATFQDDCLLSLSRLCPSQTWILPCLQQTHCHSVSVAFCVLQSQTWCFWPPSSLRLASLLHAARHLSFVHLGPRLCSYKRNLQAEWRKNVWNGRGSAWRLVNLLLPDTDIAMYITFINAELLLSTSIAEDCEPHIWRCAEHRLAFADSWLQAQHPYPIPLGNLISVAASGAWSHCWYCSSLPVPSLWVSQLEPLYCSSWHPFAFVWTWGGLWVSISEALSFRCEKGSEVDVSRSSY